MRLATIITAGGLRLHVRGANGYVDVASATGDERLSELSAVLEGGADALERVRGAAELDGREVFEAEFGERVADALARLEVVTEASQDAAGQRDVAQLDLDSGRTCERAQDRQQR